MREEVLRGTLPELLEKDPNIRDLHAAFLSSAEQRRTQRTIFRDSIRCHHRRLGAWRYPPHRWRGNLARILRASEFRPHKVSQPPESAVSVWRFSHPEAPSRSAMQRALHLSAEEHSSSPGCREIHAGANFSIALRDSRSAASIFMLTSTIPQCSHIARESIQ